MLLVRNIFNIRRVSLLIADLQLTPKLLVLEVVLIAKLYIIFLIIWKSFTSKYLFFKHLWNWNFYMYPLSSKLYLLNLPPLSSDQNIKEFYVQNLPGNYNWDFMNFLFFWHLKRINAFLRHKTLVILKI